MHDFAARKVWTQISRALGQLKLVLRNSYKADILSFPQISRTHFTAGRIMSRSCFLVSVAVRDFSLSVNAFTCAEVRTKIAVLDIVSAKTASSH